MRNNTPWYRRLSDRERPRKVILASSQCRGNGPSLSGRCNRAIDITAIGKIRGNATGVGVINVAIGYGARSKNR